VSDEEAIRALLANWHRFSAAGDVENVLPLMSEDVVFLVAGHEPMRGRDAFAKASAGMQGRVRFESTYDIEELRVAAPLAYARTFLRVAAFPSDGSAPIRRSGWTLSIFEKRGDESWVLIRDANLLTVD
jgi:uncharacterized protein (TIGR02246 family)